MSTMERLDILHSGEVISTDAYRMSKQYIDFLAPKLQVDWDGETAGMFATHLAVGLERMLQGEPLTDLPPMVRAESRQLKKETEMARNALLSLDGAEKLTTSEEEILFLATYLAVLTHKRG